MTTGEPTKLSASMKQVLRNIQAGQSPMAHCQGRSQFGGTTRTVYALCRRGLVTPAMELTAKGLAALTKGQANG